MPKQYKEERIQLSLNDLIDLAVKGYDFEKEIKRESHSSGVIRVPSKFVGQTFRVILIPKGNLDERELKEEMKLLKEIK